MNIECGTNISLDPFAFVAYYIYNTIFYLTATKWPYWVTPVNAPSCHIHKISGKMNQFEIRVHIYNLDSASPSESHSIFKLNIIYWYIFIFQKRTRIFQYIARIRLSHRIRRFFFFIIFNFYWQNLFIFNWFIWKSHCLFIAINTKTNRISNNNNATTGRQTVYVCAPEEKKNPVILFERKALISL